MAKTTSTSPKDSKKKQALKLEERQAALERVNLQQYMVLKGVKHKHREERRALQHSYARQIDQLRSQRRALAIDECTFTQRLKTCLDEREQAVNRLRTRHTCELAAVLKVFDFARDAEGQ